MNDLFGNPINELLEPVAYPEAKPKRRENPNGYAARPGTGPANHFCRDCRHAVKVNGGRRDFWKCKLCCQRWTHGYGSDIRLKSPACRHWAPKVQKDPDGQRL